MSSSEESSNDGLESDENDDMLDRLSRLRENDPNLGSFTVYAPINCIQNMTDEQWEQLGRDIASNQYLTELFFCNNTIDDRNASSLFRGLTGSTSIKVVCLLKCRVGLAGIQSMVPFLQNAQNLTNLNLHGNNITSEGFNSLFRALRDSQVEGLFCSNCGLDSIEIANDCLPKRLTKLSLNDNNIGTDGCHQVAKLLQGENSVLTTLRLGKNNIDDEGVAILVQALRNNTSLKILSLLDNDGITTNGMVYLLKLACDISSIKSTLRSNHILETVDVDHPEEFVGEDVWHCMSWLLEINNANKDNPDNTGREKVIFAQLNSKKRLEMCRIQGVNQTNSALFSDIDPLHLPEILALIGRTHGHGELYTSLLSTIMTLISKVDRKKCLQQQRDYHVARAEELDAEIAAIEQVENNFRSNKRRRRWYFWPW